MDVAAFDVATGQAPGGRQGPTGLAGVQVVCGGAVQEGGVGELEGPRRVGGVLPGDLTGAGVENDRQGVVVALPRCRYPTCQVGAVGAEGQSGADEILPFEGAVRQRGAGKSGTVVAPQGGAVPWIESGDSCTGEDQRPGWTGGHLLQLREILLPCDGRADARRMPGRTGRGRGGVGLRVGLRHGVQGHGCDHEHDGRRQGDGALPNGCGSRGPHRCGGSLRGIARFPGPWG